jgi:selenophosphate synthetase-related protein
MLETNPVRRVFWHMDDKVKDLVYGIRQGDDCIVIGDTLINMEGPYPMKIGRKTGLIHTCSDIVVMGGKPVFALNSMQVDSMEQAKEISEDLKKQSLGLGVPIVGGNTQLENDLNPCVSFVVFGKLIKEAVPDCGMESGDRVFMLGEVVEGDIGERLHRAKVKFKTFLDLVKSDMEIHASKDASRGGWFGNLAEMLVKSKKGIDITSIPYPRITRYMGTYLVAVPEKEERRIVEISAKHKCPVVEVGTIKDELEMSIGDEIFVDKKRMEELIRQFPYRKAKV